MTPRVPHPPQKLLLHLLDPSGWSERKEDFEQKDQEFTSRHEGKMFG